MTISFLKQIKSLPFISLYRYKDYLFIFINKKAPFCWGVHCEVYNGSTLNLYSNTSS